MTKETELYQNYSKLNSTMVYMLEDYRNKLIKALKEKDYKRSKVIISVIASINPLEYKELLIILRKSKEP